MNKKIIIVSMIISLLLVTVTVALGEGKPANKMLPNKVKIDNQRNFVEVLWIWEITKTLDVDEQKLASILIRLKRINNLKIETLKEKRALFLKLRNALKKNVSDEELISILQKIKDLEKNFITKKEEILQEIKEILPVKEWAKFVLVNENFEKKVRILLNNLKNLREKPKLPEKRIKK